MKYLIITLLWVSIFPFTASAKIVYMKNDDQIDAEKAWIEYDTVYVRINNDTLIDLPAIEVDIMKSSLQGRPASENKIFRPSKELVEQVITATGIKKQIVNLPDNISNSAINASQSGMNDGISQLLLRIKDSFDVNEELGIVRKYIIAHADKNTLQDVLLWSKNPSARRIFSAELAMGQIRKEDVDDYIAQIQNKQGFRERYDLMAQLEKESRASETAVKAAIITVGSLLDAIPSGITEKEKKSIRKQQLQTINQNKNIIRRRIVSNMVYSYRNVSDEDLQEYLRMLRTDSGRNFTRIAVGATEEVLKLLFRNMKRNFRD